VADEAHGVLERKPLDLDLERFELFAIAAERQRHRCTLGAQLRDRVDQEVGALDISELADIDDVGCVVRSSDGVKFVCGDTVIHAAH
jgi:hypothetical protein